MGSSRLCLRAGVLAVVLGATATATAGDPVVETREVVVAFGDSTTAPRGNVDGLCNAFGAGVWPNEAGRPRSSTRESRGNTAADGMKRFEKDVVAKNPSLVILQFGINDAAIDVWKTPPATRPRVSIETYEKNLDHFVERLTGRGAKVILMTPNPCPVDRRDSEALWEAALPAGRSGWIQRHVGRLCRDCSEGGEPEEA